MKGKKLRKRKELDPLTQHWYSILKESGFKDIEYKNGALFVHNPRTLFFDDREKIAEFFRNLDHYLGSDPEIPDLNKTILTYFSEGMRIGEIAKRVNKNAKLVYLIITAYKEGKMDYFIRGPVKEDIEFIYATWTRSYRHGSAVGKSVNSDAEFYPQYNKVIDWLLSQPDSTVDVVALPDQPLVILGYAVSQKKVLHFLFVKEAFRNLGIEEALLKKLGKIEVYTHKTVSIKKIMQKYAKALYNPFLLYYQGESIYGIKVIG